jgi:hypothetical protein
MCFDIFYHELVAYEGVNKFTNIVSTNVVSFSCFKHKNREKKYGLLLENNLQYV